MVKPPEEFFSDDNYPNANFPVWHPAKKNNTADKGGGWAT